MHTELVVALDVPHYEKAEKVIQSLISFPVIYKVGYELFLNAGPDWVKKITDMGMRVFLDLKFNDIPNTVGKAVLQSSELGVEFVTVHLSGGKKMLDEIALQNKNKTKVLGVSVLTSFHQEDWIANVSHIAKMDAIRPIEEAVIKYAALANSHEAVYGMVCSPQEISQVRVLHPRLYLMVPGIRMEGAAHHDQSRVLTPQEAIQAGASAIVMGRPILEAEDPHAVVESIFKELS